MKGTQLDALIDDWRFTGLMKATHAAQVRLAGRRRNDRLGQRPPDRLVAGPPERRFRLRVPGDDEAARVDADVGIVRGIDASVRAVVTFGHEREGGCTLVHGYGAEG